MKPRKLLIVSILFLIQVQISVGQDFLLNDSLDEIANFTSPNSTLEEREENTIFEPFYLQDQKNIKKQNTIYFELLGVGGFYSVNFDKRFHDQMENGLGLRVGVSTSNGIVAFPMQVNYILGRKHHLEVGAGITFGNGTVSFTGPRSEFIASPSLSIKYRYQNYDKGFFFNFGPDLNLRQAVLADGVVIFGISMGYTF